MVSFMNVPNAEYDLMTESANAVPDNNTGDQKTNDPWMIDGMDINVPHDLFAETSNPSNTMPGRTLPMCTMPPDHVYQPTFRPHGMFTEFPDSPSPSSTQPSNEPAIEEFWGARMNISNRIEEKEEQNILSDWTDHDLVQLRREMALLDNSLPIKQTKEQDDRCRLAP